ncbi:SAVMC3_10250 family protein [Streptomyces aurantiacus]|uniref:SAVMC3_10250 family protein n=1 Tax=Streptomyces aurantiacus TaxID=47760 RepID=UPI003324B813
MGAVRGSAQLPCAARRRAGDGAVRRSARRRGRVRQRGAVRLLLHGSVGHLAGGQEPVEAEPPALAEEVRRQAGASSVGATWVELVTTHASALLGILTAQPDAISERTREQVPAPASPVTLVEGTRQLLAALDRQLPVETAAWMQGYARVTAALEDGGSGGVRYVVATPLYVEYAAE